MLEYILLIADEGAVSFCHYENEDYDKGVSKLIPLDKFKRIVNYASEHNLILNVLLGHKNLTDEHLRILSGVSHIKLVPYELSNSFPDAVPVLDWESSGQFSKIREKQIDNLIIRLDGYPMVDLRAIIRHFIDFTKRINIVLKDLKKLTEENLISYQYQLNRIIPLIERCYLDGKAFELNCLSDRLLLKGMNNCNAGIRHITFAPNGKFYICPGFYYSAPQNDIGSLEEGLKIPNQELLQLDHAPICSVCDAFHCKRCIYLNKITTHELNTPSRQQCMLSHMERNASRRLLRRHKPAIQNPQEFTDIPEVDYLDPLEVLQEQKTFNKIKLYSICKGDV